MTTFTPGLNDPADPYAFSPQANRYQGMAWAVAGLRRRRRGEFPLAAVLVAIGGVCVTAGFAAILVGWYGASHTVELYQQTPYLISGGLLGLGLVVTGGFLYFGYWLTRQIHVSQVTLQQLSAGFARLDGQLAQVAASNARLVELGAQPPATSVPPVGGRTAARPTVASGGFARVSGAGHAFAGGVDPSAPVVVATQRGSLFHRPDCPAVANKDGVRPVDPTDPRLRPCHICEPLSD